MCASTLIVDVWNNQLLIMYKICYNDSGMINELLFLRAIFLSPNFLLYKMFDVVYHQSLPCPYNVHISLTRTVRLRFKRDKRDIVAMARNGNLYANTIRD